MWLHHLRVQTASCCLSVLRMSSPPWHQPSKIVSHLFPSHTSSNATIKE